MMRLLININDKNMTTLNVTDRDGNEHQIEAKLGATLMEVLRDREELGVVGLCGGICSCATCHIYVDPDWASKLPAASSGEQEVLADTPDTNPQSRLGCQIKIKPEYDGLRVTIAPDG
jgi:2Fe-2S ferredoxin